MLVLQLYCLVLFMLSIVVMYKVGGSSSLHACVVLILSPKEIYFVSIIFNEDNLSFV